MSQTVIQISAVGTEGLALGKLFIAKTDTSGRYVLNRKKSASTTNAPTNMAVNKIYASDLDEAAKLLKTGDYLINLVAADGRRALRALKSVQIEYSQVGVNVGDTVAADPAVSASDAALKMLGWQIVFQALCQLKKPASRRELLQQLRISHPQFKDSNLDPDLRLITVNDLARGHHQGHEKPRRTDQGHRYDLVFKRPLKAGGRLVYERYDPASHGIWELYRDDTVTTKSKMRTRCFSGNLLQKELENAEKISESEGDFDFINEPDARARISRAIVLRRGQGAFRRALIEAYEGTCAVTGCTAIDVLEAAHIVPYRGEHTNRVDNGLLLRADIHTLFDLGYLWIEEGNIHLVAHLLDTEYGKLNNRKLRLPRKKADSPSADALAHHASETKKVASLVTDLQQEQA
ncbi:hypothetical protein DOZ80_14215 [Pseudomonas fluorescens]|uniref:HNH nuclease domain-containing protein n=1 Tax=Pseudomonas fluorescens TaxID=294 RepID=A0A327N354_PSEFL|nr:HNH endonuclease [Pseudomonas fluorescens]RAI69302.1 hypothetical protein DOZ80_14215 [Pseudomonas fluorescens]